MRAAGAAAALALENQRLSAELRARIEELRASRARLVEAGDAERRRLERNLHDGAQSRLVALAMKLRMARRRAEGQPELAALLDESSAELQASLDELRELARGIHPAVLTDRGLGAGARGAREPRARCRSRSPATAGATCRRRSRPPIYFVVAEALTNVAKYARAEQRDRDGRARGRPGRASRWPTTASAAPTSPSGSGLRGLSDRVAALDGRLELRQPAGRRHAAARRDPALRTTKAARMDGLR